MSVEQSQALVKSWIAAHEKRDIEAIRGLLATDAKLHDPGRAEPLVGFDAYKASVEQVWASFSDHKSVILEMIAAESRVVIRFVDCFCHTADFFELHASGNGVEHEGCAVFHVSDKINEIFTYTDYAAISSQLLPQNVKYLATSVQYRAVPA